MNIQLHIERLVLDGVDIVPGQRHLLQASVEAELSRLLGRGGIAPQLTQGVAVPHVDADSIRTSNVASPTGLGHQIAASIYSGIGKPAEHLQRPGVGPRT